MPFENKFNQHLFDYMVFQIIAWFLKLFMSMTSDKMNFAIIHDYYEKNDNFHINLYNFHKTYSHISHCRLLNSFLDKKSN